MNRVCFISVYFGDITEKMKNFFKSCAWNLGFDWLFVSDHVVTFEVSKNVHCIYLTKEEFRIKLSEVSGITVPPFEPYKTCDFRPAFGEVFRKELENYEFWGISDTDMILGDLSKFITNELLDNYDKIYTFGHLSIIRNTDEINSLYKVETTNSRDFKKIFLNPLSCVYDEYEGFTEKMVDVGYRVYFEKKCADIYVTHSRINVCEKNRFKLIQYRNKYADYCENVNYKYQLFTIDNGKIVKYFIKSGNLEKKEYSYIHKIEYDKEFDLDLDSRYIITPTELIRCDEFFERVDQNLCNTEYFIKYNKSYSFIEKIDYLWMFARYNIRKIRKNVFPRKNEI